MKLKLRPAFPLLLIILMLLGTPAFAWQSSGLSPAVGGYEHGDTPKVGLMAEFVAPQTTGMSRGWEAGMTMRIGLDGEATTPKFALNQKEQRIRSVFGRRGLPPEWQVGFADSRARSPQATSFQLPFGYT